MDIFFLNAFRTDGAAEGYAPVGTVALADVVLAYTAPPKSATTFLAISGREGCS